LRLRNAIPIYSSREVLAVQAALAAAIAAAAPVISPSRTSGKNGSLALTISIDRAIGSAAASFVKDASATDTSNVADADLGHLSDLHSERKIRTGLVFPGGRLEEGRSSREA
jgi:hypothetical protein